jgi:Cupin domain
MTGCDFTVLADWRLVVVARTELLTSSFDTPRFTARRAGSVPWPAQSGSLRLWLDHQAHVLEAGDSFRFPSIVPHMFDNPTQQVARVIWVTTLHQTDPPAS